MSRRQPRFDLPDIAASLFAAAADSAGWPEAFGRVAEAVNGESGKLYLEASGGTALTVLAAPAYDPEVLRLYSEHYVHADPWRHAAAHIDHLPATLGHSLVDPAAFERSALWNELAVKHGKAFHLIIASMPMADGLSAKLGIHRPRHAEPFGADEQRRLNLLLPFLQRALRLGVRLGHAAARDRLGWAALMALERPAIVVDADACVLLANPAAEAAERGGAIRLGRLSGGVACARPDDTSRLHRAIRQVRAGGPGETVVAGSGAGRPALSILVTPLPAEVAGLPARRPCALLTCDAARPGVPPAALDLRVRFPLTEAEADVALRLLRGGSVSEIAEARGVSALTVRAQIRALLMKCEVRNLRELMLRLAR